MQILSNLPNTKWLHYSGSANLAHIPRRGHFRIVRRPCFNRWLNGQELLHHLASEWHKPINYDIKIEKPSSLESKNKFTCLVNINRKSVHDMKRMKRENIHDDDELNRITSFVNNFIFTCKMKIGKKKDFHSGCLTLKRFPLSLSSHEESKF